MSLQDSTLQELKDLTFALIGREYTTTSASYTRINSLWNYSANKAYRASNYWERYLVIGDERTVSNKNQVPRTQAGSDTIDTYLKICKNDPTQKRGGEYKFVVNNSGATITGNAGLLTSDLYETPEGSGFYVQPDSSEDDATVYVVYKKELDVKLATDDATTKAIPAEFMPYMAHLTAYTWQRSVDQNASDANFTLSLALVNSVLEDELAKISDQNIANSYIVKNMGTNYNTTII